MRLPLSLFVAGFASIATIYCVQPLLPSIATEFGVNAATASQAMSVTTLALPVSIILARWLRRFADPGRIIAISLLVAGLLALWSSQVADWRNLLLARLGIGFVIGLVPGLAPNHAAVSGDGVRTTHAISVFVAGTALGGMVGRALAGIVAEAVDWRTAVAVMAAMTIVSSATFMGLRKSGAGIAASPPRAEGRLIPSKAELLEPKHLAVVGTGFLAMGVMSTTYGFLPFMLSGAPFRLSTSQISSIYLSYAGGIAGSLAAARLARSLGTKRTMSGALVVLAIGSGLTLVSQIWGVIAGIAMLTAAFFAVHALASGEAAKTELHKAQGTAQTYTVAYYLGATALTFLGGYIWLQFGWAGIVAMSWLAVLACLMLQFWASKT